MIAASGVVVDTMKTNTPCPPLPSRHDDDAAYPVHPVEYRHDDDEYHGGPRKSDYPPFYYSSINPNPTGELESSYHHDERYYPEGKEYRRIDLTGPNEQQRPTSRPTSSRYANSVRPHKNYEPFHRFQNTSYPPLLANPPTLSKRSMVATDDNESLPPRQRNDVISRHTKLSQVQQYKNKSTSFWMVVVVVVAASVINIAYNSGLISRSWTRGSMTSGGNGQALKSSHSEYADLADENFFTTTFKRKRNNDLPLPEPSIRLNLYPSREGSKEFILCASPKTGCTQWTMLLNYLCFGEKKTSNPHYAGNGMALSRVRQTSPNVNSIDVPRILIMRDPYARTVSSYHDFKNRNSGLRNMTFEDFVFDYIRNTTTQSKQPADHRNPISQGCGVSWHQGGWDYVLQIEMMALWLPGLLKMLNLTDIVASDWGDINAKVEVEKSLFRIPNISAEDAIRVALNGGKKELVKSIVTGHENDSTDLHTPATIGIINDIFLDDFVLGGYRLRQV